mmetsp:Transcript_16072/g.27327  ORF Transcript_16072/g.27327 Transcript_16072/m.27327 type:complete len:333 (-) Transcript_16072:104-1102(-)
MCRFLAACRGTAGHLKEGEGLSKDLMRAVVAEHLNGLGHRLGLIGAGLLTLLPLLGLDTALLFHLLGKRNVFSHGSARIFDVLLQLHALRICSGFLFFLRFNLDLRCINLVSFGSDQLFVFRFVAILIGLQLMQAPLEVFFQTLQNTFHISCAWILQQHRNLSTILRAQITSMPGQDLLQSLGDGRLLRELHEGSAPFNHIIGRLHALQVLQKIALVFSELCQLLLPESNNFIHGRLVLLHVLAEVFILHCQTRAVGTQLRNLGLHLLDLGFSCFHRSGFLISILLAPALVLLHQFLFLIGLALQLLLHALQQGQHLCHRSCPGFLHIEGEQ